MLDQDILSQTLNMYDGSIADKQMKFFEEYYPFTSGTVQDKNFRYWVTSGILRVALQDVGYSTLHT